MSQIDILSYVANIVFITWGLVQFFLNKRIERDKANYLNAGYEMAKRLASSLGGEHARRGQAEDIASFLKSATFNSMSRERNEVDGEEESTDIAKQKKPRIEG